MDPEVVEVVFQWITSRWWYWIISLGLSFSLEAWFEAKAAKLKQLKESYKAAGVGYAPSEGAKQYGLLRGGILPFTMALSVVLLLLSLAVKLAH